MKTCTPSPTQARGSAVMTAEDYDDDFDQDGCWNCGGEGVVSSCFEEYACIDPEGGCDLCTRRCDVCAPEQARQS